MKRQVIHKPQVQSPPREFTKQVVRRIAEKYAKDKPVIRAVGWKVKALKDGSSEAIIGFFTYKPDRKSQVETVQVDVPKQISLKDLFGDTKVELYGFETVTTRIYPIRRICTMRKKRNKKRTTSQRKQIQPGEVIYSAGQNELGTICSIVDIVNSQNKTVSYILSAQHVLTNDTFTIGQDSVFQPKSNGQLRKVGTLRIVGEASNANLSEMTDYALAEISGNKPKTSEIKGLGLPDAPAGNIVSGDEVKKSGSTSAVTAGIVDFSTLIVPGGQNAPGDVFAFTVAAQPNQIFTDFATDGDSGSVVAVIDDTGKIKPAGLLVSWAELDTGERVYFALSISDILATLNATMHPNPNAVPDSD